MNQLLKEFKMMRKQFKELGKQGGFGAAMMKRGFRKRKQKQLKEMGGSGQLPMDLSGLSGLAGSGGPGRSKDKKRKKKKRR